MRYFVVTCGDEIDSVEHVLGEIVRDRAETPEDREVTLASGITGDRAEILTRLELRETESGRAALDAWMCGDDGEFDRESDRLTSEEETPAPRLRLIHG